MSKRNVVAGENTEVVAEEKWWMRNYFASASLQNCFVYLFIIYLLFMVCVKQHPLHPWDEISSCPVFIRVFLD